MGKRPLESNERAAAMLGRLVHQRWRIMSFEHDRFLEARRGPVRLDRLGYLLCLSSRQIRRWVREGKIATVAGLWAYDSKDREVPLVPHAEVLRLLDEQIGFLEIDGRCCVDQEGVSRWTGYRMSATKAARLFHGHGGA